MLCRLNEYSIAIHEAGFFRRCQSSWSTVQGHNEVILHSIRNWPRSEPKPLQAIGSDSGVSDELHALQASSFSDFLSKLSNSLESTKECFFTIYHLVKSNIEQGLTDGSLLEIDGGEENGDISEADDQTAVAVSPAPNDLSSSVQEDSANLDRADNARRGSRCAGIRNT
ncbi:unnamed protein product [Dicrocoelium dendriticum]|nr:unnamed protein product [Dicrocoelium dendriticum]